MHSSTVTQKGQITIPVEIRNELHIQPGDIVSFKRRNHRIEIVKRKSNISESFGIIKANKKVSLKDMEDAIVKGANDDCA